MRFLGDLASEFVTRAFDDIVDTDHERTGVDTSSWGGRRPQS